VNFNVSGSAQTSYVRWTIDIVAVVDGQEETIFIDEDGFKTSAPLDATEYEERWAWGVPDGRPERLVPLD
jgi:hypothetical protein